MQKFSFSTKKTCILKGHLKYIHIRLHATIKILSRYVHNIHIFALTLIKNHYVYVFGYYFMCIIKLSYIPK